MNALFAIRAIGRC